MTALTVRPYKYGIIVWMKKTLHIDENLLRDAKSASGAKTDTDTVRLGLEALVRQGMSILARRAPLVFARSGAI